MALVLVSCFVLGLLALLVVDLFRGRAKQQGRTATATALQFDEDGHRIRAPRPRWPAPAPVGKAPSLTPSTGARRSGFRPTGGRRDYFGDGTLDRSA